MKHCNKREVKVLKNNDSRLTLVISNHFAGENIVSNMYAKKIVNLLKDKTLIPENKESIIYQSISREMTIFPEVLLASIYQDQATADDMVKAINPDFQYGVLMGINNVFSYISQKANIEVITSLINIEHPDSLIDQVIDQLDKLIDYDESKTTDIIIGGLDTTIDSLTTDDINRLENYANEHEVNIILCVTISIAMDDVGEVNNKYISWLADSNISNIELDKVNINLAVAYEYIYSLANNRTQPVKIFASVKDGEVIDVIDYVTVKGKIVDKIADLSMIMQRRK